MSVEKVNKYKESKKTRKQDIEKQKKQAQLTKVVTWAVIVLVVAALVTGVVITILNTASANKTAQTENYTLSEMDLMDYANMEGTTAAEEETVEE